MITAAQKDALLMYIIDLVQVGDLHMVSRRQSFFGFEKNELRAIFTQFHEMRLIDIDNLHSNSGYYRVLMRVDAHDFVAQGGFHGKYELFQKNGEKLIYQIEKLESIAGPQQNQVKDIGKHIADYLAIISNVATIGTSTLGMVDKQA